MIKKVFSILTWIVFIIIILIAITLTTTGIETNKFNNFIENKINQDSNKVNIKLDTIKFKFDIEKISLFLEAKNPKINYRDTFIPAKNIKVYLASQSPSNIHMKQLKSPIMENGSMFYPNLKNTIEDKILILNHILLMALYTLYIEN